MKRARLVPYLSVADARSAIEWYEAVFGAVAVAGDVHEMPDGRIGHATMVIGDAEFYLADEYPEVGAVAPTSVGGSTIAIVVRVDDVDAVWERAIDHGAGGQREPANQMGFRSCWFTDPSGHRWSAMSDDLQVSEQSSDATVAHRDLGNMDSVSQE